jgi:hypothetical protein
LSNAEPKGEGRSRAFRGLALVFVLSFVNLVGVLVTATAVGGVAPWSRWQFIGMFGLVEAASGLANVLTPNIWRLPVAELQTGDRGTVKLAASTVLIPHWGALARAAAGALCLAVAAWHEGVAPSSILILPFGLALAWSVLVISALFARVGVARPDLDVVQFVVRWGRRERELSPISIGASVLQLLLSIATLPIAKLLAPSVLYQPALGPSTAAWTVVLLVSAVLTAIAYAAWSTRISWNAPADQQREAETHA